MPATPRTLEFDMEQMKRVDEYQAEHGRGVPIPQHVLWGTPDPMFPTDNGYLEVYTPGDLKGLPPPEWLIEGVIEEEGLSILAGPPGSGKTFLALDWALSIATGKPRWGDKELPGEPKSVLYILTEGFGWLDQRLEAWSLYHDLDLPEETLGLVRQNISIFPLRPEDMKADGDIARLLRTIDTMRPALVIFDTYSRVTGGMDENSNTDVNRLLPILSDIMLGFGTSILFLHHSTKDSRQVVRGAGALEGAADVVMRMQEKEGIAELSWTKVKNDERPAPISLRFVKAGVSVVLVPSSARINKNRPPKGYLEFMDAMEDPEFQVMTQHEQAEKLGVSEPTVSRYHKRLRSNGAEEPDVL